MPVQNTPTSFGLAARTFHWLTALLILTAIPLGLIANGIEAAPDTIATKTQLFSLHKTLGIAAFALGLARILWALSQPRPVALHPERRAETLVAELVHWLLYLSLVIVPLSGWVHHAALDGFAPILWPFGQSLPFVPKSETVAQMAGGLHWFFTKVMAASILLHIVGALKHHLVDRDDTLRRMTRGTSAPQTLGQTGSHRAAPLVLALAIYGAASAAALYASTPAPTAQAAPATVAATTGNWQVTAGSLGFSVQQMGAPVEGNFSNWTATITHDDTIESGQTGTVVVDIDLASLTVGAVSDQAKGPEFLDIATHPKARFTADLIRDAAGYTAMGTLSLHGVEQPLTLPFTLTITGDTAAVAGEISLDRRDFGIGMGYADEATVGYGVTVKVALTATRQ